MKKLIFLVAFVLSSHQLFADISQYPDELVALIEKENSKTEDLKQALFVFVSKGQRMDLTYSEARKILFGDLFLERLSNNRFLVKEVYCNKTIDESSGVGPGKIPDHTKVNCEHTWPQSKFSKVFPAEVQKSDLHHLFPSDMRANSTRNNHPFAEVTGRPTNETCLDSYIGSPIEGGQLSFEPPREHRGNVARAMSYFSIRYKLPVSDIQKKYFIKWNAEDPVDHDESVRHEKINQIQGNRNPFIDFPELFYKI